MKTKQIFLLLFAIVFVCGHTRAQDDFPYRPFKSFNNDTIRYLDYNFTIRDNQYVDKTVGDLFHDLEFPVVYVSNLIITSDSGNVVMMNFVIRMNRNRNEDWDNSRDYYVTIRFKTPVDGMAFKDALHSDERNKERTHSYYWNPQLYELLKSYKIGWIESNNKLFPDRRKILENSETMEELVEKLAKVMEAEKTNWKKVIQAEKQVINK